MAGESSSAHGTGSPEQGIPGILRIFWARQQLQRWRSTAADATARRPDASASSDHQQDAVCHRKDEDSAAVAFTAASHAGDDVKKPLLVLTPAECSDRQVRAVVERVGGCREGDRTDDDDGERGTGSAPTTPGAPADVPRGCCAVYVGAELRRFVVPTAYLRMPVFRRLLEKAEEEFEFDYGGGALTIPCDTEAFKYILLVMDKHMNDLVDDEGNPKEPVEPWDKP